MLDCSLHIPSTQITIVPRHVAIIMDGNRRWAKQRSLIKKIALFEGHWAGARVIFDIVEAAKEIGIKILTLFAFSTENWKRPFVEIKIILDIFQQYLQDNRLKMVEKGIKFSVIGNLTPLSEEIRDEIAMTQEATQEGKDIELVIAFNYGGKDDITRAFTKIVEKLEKKELMKDAINERLIAEHLDTAKWPDPDLLIRTSAEQRISNFMLWQLAYSEIYTTQILWPDFRPQHLVEAVLNYQQRQRRIGK